MIYKILSTIVSYLKPLVKVGSLYLIKQHFITDVNTLLYEILIIKNEIDVKENVFFSRKI